MRGYTIAASLVATVLAQSCPDYLDYALVPHAPFSDGIYNLSSMRPAPACRTFNSSTVETKVVQIANDISDPDLKRLFTNSYPNTLDTAIKWKGYANGSDEELTFVITGGKYCDGQTPS